MVKKMTTIFERIIGISTCLFLGIFGFTPFMTRQQFHWLAEILAHALFEP